MTRFGRVLKLDFVEGYKPMLWGTLCMMLLYLFFFWFAHNIGMHESRFDWYDAPEDVTMLRVRTICEAVGAFSLMACFIFFLISASTLFRGEQKKQKRIAWLMLPATNMEKFLSRWIYMLVFMLVGGVLTIVLADCIHIIWLQIADHPVHSMTKTLVHNLPHVNKYNPLLEIVNIYLAFVVIHSLFLLGGVFFKKFHFIATSAILAIVFSVIVWTINSLGYRDTPTQSDPTMSIIIWMCIDTCIITVCTWLAYRLFCRWQVVTHKFAHI